MEAIVDNFKQTVDALLELKIGMSKNIDLLDEHSDFSDVTELYMMMSGEVYELINNVFCKLFPDEARWGCQTIITCWQNLFDADFHRLLHKAMDQYYHSQQIDYDLVKLRHLTDEATKRYNVLIAA